LLVFGALALPAHAYLFADLYGWWPLNILLTFAVAVGVLDLSTRGRDELAAAVFVIGGALVEYWWPGVALVIAATWHFQRPTGRTLVLVAVALVGLCAVNLNGWALLALPVAAAAVVWSPTLLRLRWAFWLAYPLHLLAIAILSALMG
ncbi:TraX family protein, partial [Lysobacter sp. A3-1-A15]